MEEGPTRRVVFAAVVRVGEEGGEVNSSIVYTIKYEDGERRLACPQRIVTPRFHSR